MALEIERRFLILPITPDIADHYDDILFKINICTTMIYQYYTDGKRFRSEHTIPFNGNVSYTITEKYRRDNIIREENEIQYTTTISEYAREYNKHPHISKHRSRIIANKRAELLGIKEMVLDEFEIQYQQNTRLRILEIEFNDIESCNKFSLQNLPKQLQPLVNLVDKEITDILFLNNIHLAQYNVINQYLNLGVNS